MSRETDSPFPGRGPEPYGEPGAPGAAGGPDAAEGPDQKKTETTLTTRVKISIPGSRPIPPVVVREPVRGEARSAEPAGDAAPAPESGAGPAGPPGLPAPHPSGAEPAADGRNGSENGRKASSWFEPRKPVGGGSGGTPPMGVPAQATGAGPGTPGGGTPPYGTPGHPGGESYGGGPGGPPGALPTRPTGRTAGPQSGGMPLPPPPGPSPAADLPRPAAAGPGEPPGATTMELGAPLRDDTGPAAGVPPQGHPPEEPYPMGPGPGAGPFPGGPRQQPETGALPQLPSPFGPVGGPAVPPPGPTPPPAVPHDRTPPQAGHHGGGHDGHDDYDGHGGYEEYAEPAAEPEPPRRKGRGKSLLTVALAVLIGAGVLAYGAGLLLSQHDVPEGTTVLGHDIGGGTTQEAVNKLEAALGEAADAPLILVIDGQEVELRPSVAGLAVDTESTVRIAGAADYNPVTVIGSLLDSSRVVEPVFAVDEEKLTAALEDIAAQYGGAEPENGHITFDSEGAHAHYGSPGVTVDAVSAAPAVRQAFRERIETGSTAPVELATTEVQPEITDEEVDAAMAEFAEPAMSGLVRVTTESGFPFIDFSPENSIHQFIGMEAVDGRLVDVYDTETLAGLYGGTFSQVLITRGDGSQTPPTPEEIAGLLRQALRETDPEQRVAVIRTNPE
ncbi:hypothetical protein [Streptomyces aidingensis]|uniref:Peptidoglycan binding domain-containing protein n=1 Tax=Streptomyces aidingensis TaxID=910347 RepID=A0A1I1EUY6_9ACTN|nr:hypothetical protein [Streptomyces aidingensis]SFB90482.1 hypothetical protein SAMN05421773_101461 [Streptomyces aidingensis]